MMSKGAYWHAPRVIWFNSINGLQCLFRDMNVEPFYRLCNKIKQLNANLQNWPMFRTFTTDLSIKFFVFFPINYMVGGYQFNLYVF